MTEPRVRMRTARGRTKSKGKTPGWVDASGVDPFALQQLQSLQMHRPSERRSSGATADSLTMSLAGGSYPYYSQGHAAEMPDDKSAVVPTMSAVWEEEPQMVSFSSKKRRVSQSNNDRSSMTSTSSSTKLMARATTKNVQKHKPPLPMLHKQEQDPVQLVKGGLVMAMQPAEYGRFRYTKEGRKTPLHGRVEGKFPTVAVASEFRKYIPDGTMINGTVVTRHMDANGNPMPHWHVLEGPGGEPVAQRIQNGQVEFKNLVVNRNTFEVHGVRTRQYTDDQQVIRLMFEALFVDPETGKLLKTRVISDPVYGTELKIQTCQPSWVPAFDATEVIFLTSKVKKKNVSIRVIDPNPTANRQEVLAAGWELDSNNRPCCKLKQLHVHHQFAIVVKLPPYWDKTIRSTRHIEVRLRDEEYNQESPPITVLYKPPSVLFDELKLSFGPTVSLAAMPPLDPPLSHRTQSTGFDLHARHDEDSNKVNLRHHGATGPASPASPQSSRASSVLSSSASASIPVPNPKPGVLGFSRDNLHTAEHPNWLIPPHFPAEAVPMHDTLDVHKYDEFETFV